MKNIFGILKFDFKNVAKNIIVFVVIIGIVILPALYSWFNIASNWDPYSNTAGLDFAVCNNDDGYKYNSLSINAGDKIVDNLKANPKMGWDFVSEKKALDGVKNGKYYAAVVIPKDFSKNLFSITTGNFNRAKLKYYSNEKRNAIAPKITDKGAEAIESAVKSTYVDKMTETIASVLNITGDTVSSSKKELSDKIISALNDTKDDIKAFGKTNDLFVTTLKSTNELLKTNEDLGPKVKSALNKAGVMTSDIKQALKGLSSSSPQITESLEDILSQGRDYINDVDEDLTEAFGDISGDSASAADKLSKVTKINSKIIDINNKALTVIGKVQDTFPKLKFTKLTNKLKASISKQQKIITKINNACKVIRNTGSLPKNTQNEIKTLVSEGKSELTGIKSDFADKKKSIDNSVGKVYSALDDVSEFVSSIGSGNSVNKIITAGENTVDNLIDVFNNINDILDNADKKIDNLIERVNDLKNSKKIENFLTPIINNPKALGNFVASPVETEKERIYPIENYGSAMTPFYTSLGLWVGGVVLVAVISVAFSKRELKTLNNPTPAQLFFGRYLIFFILSQLQALVIALGDLFFLKIQCADPLLFIVGSMISSFVYSLIIYSLTITFSVLGKALSVIILVLQVAGSGGTFPIEVLPAPFQAMSTYLPFKYGINALREAVAGVDIGSYWTNLGILMLFVLGALFVGLFLRRPCMKAIEFFNERIEDSDIVI